MGLTIEEAAECTGIGRNTMRKLVDWGKLPVLKVGRKAAVSPVHCRINRSREPRTLLTFSLRSASSSGRVTSAGLSDLL